LYLIGIALVPAAALAVIGWKIDATFSGPYQRLLCGGIACVICIASAASFLMPTEVKAAFRRIGFGRVRKA
jgi:hypothetical protein